AVDVVASCREGAVLRSGQRRLRRLLGEDPLERRELPGLAALLVDEDRWLVRGEAADLRVQEVPAHVRDHLRDVDGVARLPGRIEARRVLRGCETGLGDDRCERLRRPVGRRMVVCRLRGLRPPGSERHGPCGGAQEREDPSCECFANDCFPQLAIAAGTGSGRTMTVSVTAMISVAGRPAAAAWRTIASGSDAW